MRRLSLALAAGLALLVSAPSAFAQADPHAGHHPAANVQTIPADGAMGAAPAEFSVTFPHAMQLTSLSVTLQGGAPVVAAIPMAVPAETVTVPLPALSPGNYTIEWTATGADGHVMSGAVRYMVH